MKIAMIIVRSLMGLMFLFASLAFFFKFGGPQPAPAGGVKLYMEGINTLPIMNIVKTIELLCGLAFISGRFVTLATVIIFPIIVNIILFHAYLGPKELPLTLALLAGDLFLAYYYRNNYRTLFAAK